MGKKEKKVVDKREGDVVVYTSAQESRTKEVLKERARPGKAGEYLVN